MNKLPVYPASPGIYEIDTWCYYLTRDLDSASEIRIGRLFDGAQEISGRNGEIRTTPLGRFAYFEDDRNRGWLNTLTRDRAVFDAGGRFTQAAWDLLYPETMKPGTTEAGSWRYEYAIESKGSRSERRFGALYYDDEVVGGKSGETKDTPLGRFAFFADFYNVGWLAILTDDRPVFDEEGGFTEDALACLGPGAAAE